MVTMRAKFVVSTVMKLNTSECVIFRAVGKPEGYPEDGSDEDNTFAKFTPMADLVVTITNPALFGTFECGKKFYADFTPCGGGGSVNAVQDKTNANGLHAPRVTPADIEAEIASEHFFTALDGVLTGAPVDTATADALSLLTFCVLVLKNGFRVTGESACASPANFDEALGRKIARQKAVEKIWPLLGFRLTDRLASQ